MKKCYIFFFILFSTFYLSAQSYNITYIQKDIIDNSEVDKLDLPESAKELYKKGIKQRQKTRFYYTLKYTNGNSMYTFLKVEQAHKTLTISSTTTYKNQKKGEMYTTGGMMREDEAIKRNIKKNYNWIFENETKSILGYKCQKAYYINDSKIKTTVWYAIKIPIMDGPSIYAGVPGLILQVETNRAIITASKIDKNINEEQVKIPNFKQFTTPESYRKLFIQKAKKKEVKKNK